MAVMREIAEEYTSNNIDKGDLYKTRDEKLLQLGIIDAVEPNKTKPSGPSAAPTESQHDSEEKDQVEDEPKKVRLLKKTSAKALAKKAPAKAAKTKRRVNMFDDEIPDIFL